MKFENLHESTLYEVLDNISDVMYNLHFKTTPHYLKEDIKQFMMMKCLNTLKIKAYDPYYSCRNYFMSCCRNAGSVYIYHSNKLSVCFDISDEQVPELTTPNEDPVFLYSREIYEVCKDFEEVYGDMTTKIIDIFKWYGIDVNINHEIKESYDNNVKPSNNTLQRILGLCMWNIVERGI